MPTSFKPWRLEQPTSCGRGGAVSGCSSSSEMTSQGHPGRPVVHWLWELRAGCQQIIKCGFSAKYQDTAREAEWSRTGLSKEQEVTAHQWLWSGRQTYSSTDSQHVTQLELTLEFTRAQTHQAAGSGQEAECHSSTLREGAEGISSLPQHDLG